MLAIVGIIDELGAGNFRALARPITRAVNADYMIFAIHRAKGLECKRVKMANDFRLTMIDGRSSRAAGSATNVVVAASSTLRPAQTSNWT
jgi:hypothetical protein